MANLVVVCCVGGVAGVDGCCFSMDGRKTVSSNVFRKGDLVEAKVRWRIGEDNPFQIADWETELLYPMTVVERARPELPTEPGIYLDVCGNVVQLVYEERWFNEYGVYMTHSEARECAPFTRLESVADTAKKIIDEIESRLDEHETTGDAHFINVGLKIAVSAIANKFGSA